MLRTQARRFTLLETTSGLPHDSREEDEWAAAKHLRDLRGRVKRARAVVSTTPGLAETLRADWRKAARFYARFGVTEAMFRHGVPADAPEVAEDILDQIATFCDPREEARMQTDATLPSVAPSGGGS